MLLLEIYFSFQQWKNFENPIRTDKAIAMSLVYYFLGHGIDYEFYIMNSELRKYDNQ